MQSQLTTIRPRLLEMSMSRDLPRIGPASDDGSGLDELPFVITYRDFPAIEPEGPVDPILEEAASVLARRRHTENAALWAVQLAQARAILRAVA